MSAVWRPSRSLGATVGLLVVLGVGFGCSGSRGGRAIPRRSARGDDSAHVVSLARAAYQQRRALLGFGPDTAATVEVFAPNQVSGRRTLTWVQFRRGDSAYRGGNIAVVWGDSLARIVDTLFAPIQ